MSLNFNEPVNEQTKGMVEAIFGRAVASDNKTFLYDEMPLNVDGRKIKEIADQAKQPVRLEVNNFNDVKVVGGIKYKMTPVGWVVTVD